MLFGFDFANRGGDAATKSSLGAVCTSNVTRFVVASTTLQIMHGSMWRLCHSMRMNETSRMILSTCILLDEIESCTANNEASHFDAVLS